jgi:hypothetical protein
MMTNSRENYKRKSALIHDRDQLWASMRDIKDGITQVSETLSKNLNLTKESEGILNEVPCVLLGTDVKIVHSCVLTVLTELMLYEIDSEIHKWND